MQARLPHLRRQAGFSATGHTSRGRTFGCAFLRPSSLFYFTPMAASIPESSAGPWHVGPLQWVPWDVSPYNITREVFPTPLHPLSSPKSGGNFNRYPKGTHLLLKKTVDPFFGELKPIPQRPSIERKLCFVSAIRQAIRLMPKTPEQLPGHCRPPANKTLIFYFIMLYANAPGAFDSCAPPTFMLSHNFVFRLTLIRVISAIAYI